MALLVSRSPACGVNNLEQCPDCRAGAPCPRDVLYQSVALTGVYNGGKPLTNQMISDLFKNYNASRLFRWGDRFSVLAAHAAWYVIDQEV